MKKINEVQKDEITKYINNIDESFFLWEIYKEQKKEEIYLTIHIDRKDHTAISMSEILDVSEKINLFLDENFEYLLEDVDYVDISSPGAERTLEREDHFKWSEGYKINITLNKENNFKKISGILKKFNNETNQIEYLTEDKEKNSIVNTIPISSVKKVLLELF